MFSRSPLLRLGKWIPLAERELELPPPPRLALLLEAWAGALCGAPARVVIEAPARGSSSCAITG